MGLSGILCLVLTLGLALGGLLVGPPAAYADLPSRNALKDGAALLRYALPFENAEIQGIQGEIEDVSESLRGLRWSSAAKDVQRAGVSLALDQATILAEVTPANQPEATVLLDKIKDQLSELTLAIDTRDKETTLSLRRQILTEIGDVESLMVKSIPFEVPPEYGYLPQLKGRATIEMTTEKGTLVMVADGYNAPITAGNFVDLVDRGFYDGLPIDRVEDFYVVQFGDPVGPATGFIDPATGQERTIPLEVRVVGDQEPIYEFTLEEMGLYLEEPILPFAAYGTLGMARPLNDVNAGSSQVFFFLYEPDMVRAGANILDGRYAAFGYVVEGLEVLQELRVGDKILGATVVQGADNLIQPTT
jgi:peptidylprolyl isomerase